MCVCGVCGMCVCVCVVCVCVCGMCVWCVCVCVYVCVCGVCGRWFKRCKLYSISVHSHMDHMLMKFARRDERGGGGSAGWGGGSKGCHPSSPPRVGGSSIWTLQFKN